MNKNEFYKLLNEYLDGTVSNEGLSRLMQAVDSDPAFKKEFDAYGETINMVRSMPAGIIPPTGMWDNIESRLVDKSSSFIKVSDNFYTFNQPELTDINYTEINKQRTQQLPTRYIVTGLIAAGLIIAFMFGIKDFISNQNDQLGSQQLAALDTYWLVSNVKGAPTVDDKLVAGVDSVKIGDWLVTDDTSQAVLKVSDIGTIVVDPGSKVRIIKSDAGEHRIILEYGTISANINAAPRTFFVETKSVTAVDLGCSYSLSMDKKGDGILFVKEGMVELTSDKRNTLVSAGKYCLTKNGMGPGTPYRDDSSIEFKRALLDYDFKNGGAAALNKILQTARKTDAVTLLNLMPFVDKNSKEKVYAKLASLVPTPGDLPKDSIYYFDYKKMNEWIDDITREVNKEMEKMNKELYNMNYNFNFNFDSLKYSDEMRKELEVEMKELQKELKESMKEFQFDQEEFKRDMEEMKKELKENLKNNEYFNSEEFQRDMEELQQEMKENSEYFDSQEFQKEMEQMQNELNNSIKESMKSLEYLNSEEFQEKLNEEIQKDIEKEQKRIEQEYKYKYKDSEDEDDDGENFDLDNNDEDD